MLTTESYAVDATTSFDVEIAASPTGKKLPLVVVVHGNFGLGAPFGGLLRSFTEELAALGFVAALLPGLAAANLMTSINDVLRPGNRKPPAGIRKS